jgi:adenylylsulfate kinase-like enzyme
MAPLATEPFPDLPAAAADLAPAGTAQPTAANSNSSTGCVILLDGFPGVSKLSIARSLQTRLEALNRRVLLVDCHLMIDPADAVHPGRGDDYRSLKDRFRQVVFADLKTVSGRDKIIILTGCISTWPGDDALLEEHLDLARARDVSFVWYNLECQEREHVQRIQSPARIAGAKRKLTDPGMWETLSGESADDERDLEEYHVKRCPLRA